MKTPIIRYSPTSFHLKYGFLGYLFVIGLLYFMLREYPDIAPVYFFSGGLLLVIINYISWFVFDTKKRQHYDEHYCASLASVELARVDALVRSRKTDRKTLRFLRTYVKKQKAA
jgi:hypothetical protein